MMRLVILLVLSACLLAEGVAVEAPLANAGRKGLEAKTIDEMLALPDEEIDIGLGALLIGKEYDPDLDVPKYLAQLDQMALQLRSRIADKTDPKKVVAVIGTYIFTDRAFAFEDNQHLLHTALDRKRANCLSLSALYLAMAERLRVPLFGVVAPGHTFVRFDSPETKFNIETTKQGAPVEDSTYAARFPVPDTPAARSFYMCSVGRRSFLALLLYNVGSSFRLQGRFAEALQMYGMSVGANPNYAEAWNNSGNCQVELGAFAEAARAYRRALVISPKDAKCWENLVRCHLKQGRPHDALAAAQEWASVDPLSADAWCNLGGAYVTQGKLDEAVEACRRALDINPKDAVAWYNLGLAYFSQDKFDEAIEAFRNALSIDPKYADAWCNLGGAYVTQGKLDEAVEAYRKALEINPKDAEAWNNLGVAYHARGEYAQAWECVHKCQEAGAQVKADLLRALRRQMPEPNR